MLPCALKATLTISQRTIFAEAIRLYSQAIAGAGEDAELFANRSAAYCKAGQLEDAAQDARHSIELRPEGVKAYYRSVDDKIDNMHELLLRH